MAMLKAAQNLGRSIVGNNVKCVLCVRAKSKLDHEATLENDDEKEGISKETRSAINDLKALNEKLLKRAEDSLLKGRNAATYNDILSDVEGNGYIALEMQYNPTSIRLDTSVGRQLEYSGSADTTHLTTRNADLTTTLSCDLLFDNVNPMDAFMLNDNPLTGFSFNNTANSIISMAKGKNFSVQRQMEGLFSMISIPQARGVIFFWGSMSFRGFVTQIDNEYTMFNKKGAPVRGIVRISIMQKGTPQGISQNKVKNYDKEHWNTMFDQTFKTDIGGGIMGMVSGATNNSLMNLKL